jgi:hypothetical protein
MHRSPYCTFAASMLSWRGVQPVAALNPTSTSPPAATGVSTHGIRFAAGHAPVGAAHPGAKCPRLASAVRPERGRGTGAVLPIPSRRGAGIIVRRLPAVPRHIAATVGSPFAALWLRHRIPRRAARPVRVSGPGWPPSQGWAPPSYPLQPGYGWPAAPSTLYGYPPGAMPPPPRKRMSTPAIIGIVALALVLAIAASVGVLIALSPARGSVFSSVATSHALATSTVQAQETSTAQAAAGGYRYDFKDSLNGSSNAGWVTDTHCYFQGNAYHANTGTDYQGLNCPAPAGSFSDMDLHVTVSEKTGPLNYGYGVVFRHQSSGNEYVFVLASNGEAWFDKIVSGNITHLSDYWQPAGFYRGLGANNTLRVVARGTSFTFYINSEQVGQGTDSTYARGTLGIFSGGPSLDAAFTNFEVQGNP